MPKPLDAHDLGSRIFVDIDLLSSITANKVSRLSEVVGSGARSAPFEFSLRVSEVVDFCTRNEKSSWFKLTA